MGVPNNFKPQGAIEIKQAGYSLVQMVEKINTQIKERTFILAGVSHDLRTPITRIKLQLAMMDQSPDVKDIAQDLKEMENLIKQYLDFANDNWQEELIPINLKKYLEEILSSYRESFITLSSPEDIFLKIRKMSMRRAIINLLDNAIKYGQIINIDARRDDDNIIISIQDNGPGIPKSEIVRVLSPFL